ncbi:hypothetical protein EDC01DRAFT_193025 [Geopyxis carbonaria]|nr:hypothetical protein EDC01DRAFT_193025 [Geopyxis carbonaria]
MASDVRAYCVSFVLFMLFLYWLYSESTFSFLNGSWAVFPLFSSNSLNLTHYPSYFIFLSFFNCILCCVISSYMPSCISAFTLYSLVFFFYTVLISLTLSAITLLLEASFVELGILITIPMHPSYHTTAYIALCSYLLLLLLLLLPTSAPHQCFHQKTLTFSIIILAVAVATQRPAFTLFL